MKVKFLALLILFLTGCAHSPIDMGGMETVPANEGIVAGQVKLLDGGGEQSLSFLGESKLGLFVTPDDPAKAVYVPLKGEGAFTWHLPAGRYTITGFEWRRHGINSGRIQASFDVAAGKGAYIGTLVIKFSGARYQVAVVDDYANRAVSFRETFPQLKTVLEKQLLLLEEKR